MFLNHFRIPKPFFWLAAILLVAFAVRLGTALWLGDVMKVVPAGGTHDQVSYDLLAKRVAAGFGFTFPSPWYPWVPADTPTSYYSGTMVLHLALVYRLFGYHPLIARLLYVGMGIVVVYLIFRIGRRLFGETAGLFAAAFAAGYSYLILYSATLLTETPFIVFLLLAIEATYQLVEDDDNRWLIVLGFALAGVVVFRMAVLPFVVLLLVWIYIKKRNTESPLSLVQMFVPVAIMMLAILPWSFRNYMLFDRFMLLESQFGHVLWNSNHPDQGISFRGSWVAPIPQDLSGLSEAELTYALLERGIDNILRDPGRFFLLTLSRVKYFFTFWPTANSSTISNFSRVMSFGILLPFMLYGLFISFPQWRRLVPIYLFLVVHIGVYVVSWVMIRYRIPIDAVLILFAGLAAADLFSRYLKWSRAKA